MITILFQILFIIQATLSSSRVSAYHSRIAPSKPVVSFPPQLSTTARQAFALDSAGHAIESFYQSQPYVSAFLTCSVKASAADLAVQSQAWNENEEETSVEENANRVDLARNLAFMAHGGLYQGMAQEFFYTKLYPSLFGLEMTWHSVATQVAFDMLLMGPFVYMTSVYSFKSVIAASELSWDTVNEGLSKYWEDINERGILVKFWSIWVPVQFCTFSIIPSHFRVAFVAAVSFFWILLLSATSSDTGRADGGDYENQPSAMSN